MVVWHAALYGAFQVLACQHSNYGMQSVLKSKAVKKILFLINEYPTAWAKAFNLKGSQSLHVRETFFLVSHQDLLFFY